jgi:hypothetical protein
MDDYYLQHIIIKKSMPFMEARDEARKMIKWKASRLHVKSVGDTWIFKNLPKSRFIGRSLRTKIINDNISIIFGKLRIDDKEGV